MDNQICVMVFIRCEDKDIAWKPNWIYIKNTCDEIVWRNETSAILIMDYDNYLGTHSAVVANNCRYITEIQLIQKRIHGGDCNCDNCTDAHCRTLDDMARI